MHRSRIGVVLVDHPAATFETAAAFWSHVRGSSPIADGRPPADDPYLSLAPLPGDMLFEVQCTGVGTPPRVHLDVETDDVEAEIERVRHLGAEVVERRDGYAIMQDPGGLLFCVVPVQTGDEFERHATAWESGGYAPNC